MAEGSLFPAPPVADPVPVQSRVDLRPLTTSELIDRGFALYRSHFTGFFLLALLCQATPLLDQILVTACRLNPTQPEFLEHPGAAFTKLGIITSLGLITQIIVFCFEVIFTFYIADIYLGKIPSVTESMRRFVPRIGAAIGTSVLNIICIGLTLLFPFAALTATYFYALFYPPHDFFPLLLFGVMTVLILVASLVPVLVVFMRLWVTTPTVALEGLFGWGAIKRSSALVRYDPGLGILYWGEMRLSFILLPLFIIELLILSLTSLPLVLFKIGEAIRHGSGGQVDLPPDTTVILSQILTFLAISLILPLYPIATTLFYYDIRIRREGFDLEYMAGQLGASK